MIITVDQHAYRRSDHLGAPVLRFVTQFALLVLVVVGLAVPADYAPAAVFGGFVLATLAACRFTFELFYRPNVRAVTPRDDGLFIETNKKKERHVGWKEIRRICSRPSLGTLELIIPSGNVIIADTFRDFPELVEQIVDRTTPRTPPPPRVVVNNPLTAVFWLPRCVVITQTDLELHRLAGRRAIRLESIRDVQLVYRRVVGRLRITIALTLQNGEVDQVDLHASKQIEFYSALRRALSYTPGVARGASR